VTAETQVMRCPECGERLESVVGGEGDKRVWLLRCGGCSRAIVVLLTETHAVEV
jgi:DNA-directed RNA polymerase subunit RPC12/RpoP